MIEIRRYRQADGSEPLTDWLKHLPDRQAKARLLARIDRLESGNFGDCKFLRDGISELRIDWGPGYRIYFGRSGTRLVILLCAGDKRRQSADIERAVEYWNDYKSRSKSDEK
jgi:putative addiction module killer protein